MLLEGVVGLTSNVILVVIAGLLPHGLYSFRATFRFGRRGVCETPWEGNFSITRQYASYSVVGLRPRSRGWQLILFGICLRCLERQ